MKILLLRVLPILEYWRYRKNSKDSITFFCFELFAHISTNLKPATRFSRKRIYFPANSIPSKCLKNYYTAQVDHLKYVSEFLT